MDFSRRKLPKEAAQTLRACPLHTVKPYAPMLAPAYVYMPRNEKFVSVKAPLDFFTPEELERLKSFESLYLPDFVDSVLPFRSAARGVLTLLQWRPDRNDPSVLPPASYELADAVLRLLGPLWGRDTQIEPFFLAVFANELCELLPGELLTEVREQSVETYESAMLLSSWAVFLALHIGHCDLGFLNALRVRVFTEAAYGAGEQRRFAPVDEVISAARRSLPAESRLAPLRADGFVGQTDRVSQKMLSRLRRVIQDLLRPERPVATIFGPGGFVDV
ncbi:MAG: hypothetical protein NDJ90_04865 [Oligoflexia bacterium]|nr:hypothetical protein [Oligoflexia bacterium]